MTAWQTRFVRYAPTYMAEMNERPKVGSGEGDLNGWLWVAADLLGRMPQHIADQGGHAAGRALVQASAEGDWGAASSPPLSDDPSPPAWARQPQVAALDGRRLRRESDGCGPRFGDRVAGAADSSDHSFASLSIDRKNSWRLGSTRNRRTIGLETLALAILVEPWCVDPKCRVSERHGALSIIAPSPAGCRRRSCLPPIFQQSSNIRVFVPPSARPES